MKPKRVNLKTLNFERASALFLILFGYVLFFVPHQALSIIGARKSPYQNLFVFLIIGIGILTYYLLFLNLPPRNKRRFVWLPASLIFIFFGVASFSGATSLALAIIALCLSGLFLALFLVKSPDPTEKALSFGLLGCATASIPFALCIFFTEKSFLGTAIPNYYTNSALLTTIIFAILLIIAVIKQKTGNSVKIFSIFFGISLFFVFLIVGLGKNSVIAITPFFVWPVYIITNDFFTEERIASHVGSFKQKILTFLAFTVIITLTTLTLISDKRILDFHTKSIEESVYSSGLLFVNSLNYHFEEHREIGNSIIERLELEFPKNQEDFAKKYVEDKKTNCFKQASVFNKDGHEILRTDSEPLGNLGNEDWFIQLKKTKPSEKRPFIVEVGHPYVIAASPAFDQNGDLSFGLVQYLDLDTHIAKDDIKNLLDKNEMGFYLVHFTSNEFTLITKAGAKFNKENPFENWSDLIKNQLLSETNENKQAHENSTIVENENSDKYFWLSLPLNVPDLNLIVIHSRSTIDVFRDASREISMIIIMISFVITVLISYILSWVITKPMYKLKNLIENQGDIFSFKTKKEIYKLSKKTDEIGLLAKAYYDSNQTTMNVLMELSSEKKEEDKLYKKLKENSDQLVEASFKEKRSLLELESLNHTLSIEKSNVESILQSIGDGIVVLDHGYIINFNNAAEYITGFKKDELLAKYLTEAINFKEENGLDENKCRKYLDKNSSKTLKKILVLKRKDGRERTVAVIFSPIQAKDSKQILGHVLALRDVTEERELDRAKSEFVSVASHQLRTPLTAIKWNVELLRKGAFGKLSKDQSSSIGDMEIATANLIKLVNDLLSVSRIEQGRLINEPIKINLGEILSEVIKEVGPIATQKKIDLKVNIGKTKQIFVDKMLIKQVLQNLIDNAIKYTPDKGLVKVSLVQKDDKVVFEVTDSGMGIPQKEQSSLFKKFFRASNAAGSSQNGTGLGLYIAKQIVDLSKGKIEVRSEEGKGTKFIIMF